MPDLILILLKINLLLLVVAALYFLILRRLTFYGINRFFLVAGIAFSSAYPFLDLNKIIPHSGGAAAALSSVTSQLGDRLTGPEAGVEALSWLPGTALFYVGAIAMLMRFFLQLISLYRIHKRSIPGVLGDHPVRILESHVAPFSFWQAIYINPSLHQKKELAAILAHEQIHIKQWHSLDILFAELSVIVYWFNPGVWLMKNAIKENLEFITDKKVLTGGMNKRRYQYALLGASKLISPASLVSSFSVSAIKRRILMMSLKRSSPLQLSRYIVVVPVMMVIAFCLGVSKDPDIAKVGSLKSEAVNTSRILTPAKPLIMEASTDVPQKISQRPLKKKRNEVTVPKPPYEEVQGVLWSDDAPLPEEQVGARQEIKTQEITVVGRPRLTTSIDDQVVRSVQGVPLNAIQVKGGGVKAKAPLLILKGYKLP